MTTKHTLKITFQNGDIVHYKELAHFEFMQQGLLFVEGIIAKKLDTMGLIIKKVTYSNARNWYPIAIIKHVEVQTVKSIEETEEIRKYEKFLEHGIDIMVTKISHTEPPDPEAVAKEIALEEKRKEKAN